MALSGIELSSGIVVGSSKSLDAKYGPYDSVADALVAVGPSLRYSGLTLGVREDGVVVEYWFPNGTNDADIEMKFNLDAGVF